MEYATAGMPRSGAQNLRASAILLACATPVRLCRYVPNTDHPGFSIYISAAACCPPSSPSRSPRLSLHLSSLRFPLRFFLQFSLVSGVSLASPPSPPLSSPGGPPPRARGRQRQNGSHASHKRRRPQGEPRAEEGGRLSPQRAAAPTASHAAQASDPFPLPPIPAGAGRALL
eukprot:scaffold58480_cov27-Tisochrysis_lutea.AAC.6